MLPQPVSGSGFEGHVHSRGLRAAIVLVFNKWDAMDEFDKQRLERLWNTEFDRGCGAERVNLSAKTGWHTNRLTRAMDKALNPGIVALQGSSNAFLGKIQAAHPHPLRWVASSRESSSPLQGHPRARRVSRIFATGFRLRACIPPLHRGAFPGRGIRSEGTLISVNIREKKKRK